MHVDLYCTHTNPHKKGTMTVCKHQADRLFHSSHVANIMICNFRKEYDSVHE